MPAMQQMPTLTGAGRALLETAGAPLASAASAFVGMLLALTLALLPLQSAHATTAWKAHDDDALLFDLRSGKYTLGDGIRGYQTDIGICVDLADVIIAMDLPIRLDKKSRRATGWVFSENETLVIDRDSATVQKVNGRSKLKNGQIHDTPEGWCVDVKSLSAWLDVTLTPDLPNALLLLEADRKLPFESALERKERAAKIRPKRSFDLASLPQSTQEYKFWRTPSVDVVVSAGGLQDQQSGQQFDVGYEVFAVGEVGKASFEARLSSDDRGIPENLRVRAFRTSGKADLLGPLKATNFALGDVSTLSTPLVSQNSAGRGASVTNRPIEQPDSFDRTSFRGELPAGWDAELYRNGQLLAFADNRSDGRYEFIDVPLRFGKNFFEVVLYGPQGQVRRETKSIAVGRNSIPPRQTFYWAGFQDTGQDLISLNGVDDSRQRGLRGGFILERGLNNRTSVAASFFSLKLDGERLNFAEASLRRSLGPTLIELSAASDLSGGTAFRGQLLGEIGKTRISGETLWAQGNFESDRVEQTVNTRHRLALDHVFRLSEKAIPFHIETQYETRSSGSRRLSTTADISYRIRRVSLTARVDWDRTFLNNGSAGPDRLEAALLLNGSLKGIRLRGEARYQFAPSREFRSLDVTGEWGHSERSSWRADLGFDPPLNRARFGLGYVRKFDKFSLTASAEGATDGSVAAGLNLAFSLGPDPRNGRIRVSSNKLARNGQALALVFNDRNGDGIRQANETAQPGVELTAGQAISNQPTDENGFAIVDNLSPFRPVLIGVDTSSLDDPFIQPALPGVVVTPRPGVIARIELPLVSAGEVEGTLVGSGGAGLSGVGLELLDKKGRVVGKTQTEFDGFFLFESVPYGEYRVQIDKLSAQAIRVLQPIGKTIRVDDDQTIGRLGIISPTDNAVIASNNKSLDSPGK